MKGGFIERAMVEWRIVTAACAVLIAFGVAAFLTMPRQEFPEFTVRQGLVVAVMPGAAAKQVDEQVTRPVENYLFGFKEVNKKKTYSVSKDGQVVVFVEINEDVKGHEAKLFWATLRHGLNELKAQKLPTQVVALVGNNDFGDTSAVLFTVEAEGRSPRDMEKYLQVLETQLRRLPATSKLNRFGAQQEVIRITLDYDRLAKYGIRAASVWSSLQSLGSLPVPARLDRDEIEMPVHVQDVLRSERELEEAVVLVAPTGQHVRLKDIATVRREYGHDDSFIRHNGKTAVVLSVEMLAGNDITAYGKQVDEAIDAAVQDLPPEVKIRRIADQPKVVGSSVGHFLRDFGISVASVIAVTLLLLPLRVASVAALTIPICIVITIGILQMLGLKLEIVSLAGLILVLGMVVDNAIVIIDDHVERLDHGENPWDAAWKSARSLSVPVFTATLAIVAAYVPLAFVLGGMASEFLGSLPTTIAVALGVSLLISVLLVPWMSARLIRRGLKGQKRSGRRSALDVIQGVFNNGLEAAFRHRWLTVLCGVASVVVAVLIASSIPQQMFPKMDRNQFAVEVYLPNGSALARTDELVRRIEKDLMADGRVVDVTAFVGTGSPRFHTLYAPNMPGRHYAQLVVNTTSDETAVDVVSDFESKYAGRVAEGWVKWKQLDLNPGRAPVEVRLSGNDIESIRTVAERIKQPATSIPGVTWVRDDYEDALRSIEVVPDADALSRLGLSPAMLRTSLALGTQGLPIATVWEGDYPVKVIVEDEETARGSFDGLLRQKVSSLWLGASVPLEQVARLEPAWGDGAIIRRNGVPTLTVRLDTRMGVLGSDVQKKVEAIVASLGPTPGVAVDYGSEKEMSADMYPDLGRGLAITVAAIYLILLAQFRRHRLAMLIMGTMPLSLLGAVIGLVVTGYPFGFTAFVGIISLMGIVVRNGIILIGCAEDHRKAGMDKRAAAIAAGKRRMRPIYLTTMAAAIGATPLILSGSTLWGPLGAVTCFGLLVSMILTLFVLPVAYDLVSREHPMGVPGGAGMAVAGVAAALLVLLVPTAARAADGPFTLAQSLDLARKNSSDVQQAQLEVEAARQTKSAAFTKYFPQVSAGAAVIVAKDPFLDVNVPKGNLPVYDGNPANLQTASQFAYFPGMAMSTGNTMTAIGATAMQPVYMGGRIRNGNRLAEVAVDAARINVAMKERDAVAQAEEKYWRVVALKEKEKTLAAFEALLGAITKQVDDGFAAGLLTRNEQLKVELQRNQAAIERVRLESGIKLAARDLRRHLGLSDGDYIDLSDSLASPVDPISLRAQAHGGEDVRPEMQMLQQAVRAEHLKAKLKRGEMLPSLSVGAAVFRLAPESVPTTTNAVAFGALTIPISGLWEASHAAASAERHAEAAEKRLAETRKLISLDVGKSWDDLWVAWQTTALAELGSEQAETNLKEVSDRHKNGLVTFSDVLEAQLLRQKALDKQIDVRSEYWLKRSAFLRAIGRQFVEEKGNGHER
jgi:multidrug efflux pump subunit AcrB/outer membrane protein TolC